jgi:geranylgeranyl diphosphate synthase type I
MDGSLTRRGAPTTHESYGAQHKAQQLAGESRRFGEGAAILIGDLSFVYSDQLLSGASTQVWQIWNEMRLELNIGQYLDLLGSANSDRSMAKAERICRYKSGKYTVERPLQLGAMLAAPQSITELLDALSRIGLPLGDAFQMRDDVLGAFGEAAVTGKPVGDDLREGKPTPLMAIATANASAAQLEILQQVGAARLTDDQVADVQQVLVETGAVEQLEARIRSNTAAALGEISAAPITSQARDALTELAHFVSWRDI